MKGFKSLKDDQTEVKNRFGFRKLSIGLTTVFLGSIFFLAGGQTVHAAVNTPNSQQTSSVVQGKQSTSPRSTVQPATSASKQDTISIKPALTGNGNTKQQNSNQEPVTGNKLSEVKKDNGSGNTKTALTVNNVPTNTTKIGKSSNIEQQLRASAIKVENGINPLSEEQSNKNVTATITATTADGTPINKNTELEAKNNAMQVNVKVDAGEVASFNNSTFDINFGDTGDSAADGQSWYVYGYKKNDPEYIDDAHHYRLIYNGNGDFTVKVVNDVGSATSVAGFQKTFDLLGTKANAENGSTTLPVTVTYKNGSDTKTLSSKNFEADIVPANQTLKHGEIAHIFSHGLTNDKSQFLTEDQNNNSKKLQYIIEWNWGQNNPVNNVKFDQIFSDGQTLLPDTIRVFRVDPNQLTNPDGSRKLDLSTTGIYGAHSVIDGKDHYANEDTAFEDYLRSHMYGTYDTGEPISMNDFINAKNSNKDLPVVKSIQFSKDGPFGDNQGHDWSTNNGNAHSIFLIQMDTLLPSDIPSQWKVPGDGPSTSVTVGGYPTSSVTSDSAIGSTTVFPGFNQNGSGYLENESLTAHLHFADVTDHNDVIDLGDTTHKSVFIPESLSSSNEYGALTTTQIRFDNAGKFIKALEDDGYTFVGVSRGATNITGSHFNDSGSAILYSSKNYDGNRYEEYGSSSKDYTLNFVKLQSQKKSVSDSVKYVYENGPKAGQYVENEYAEPKSQTLSFNKTPIIGSDENVVYPENWTVDTGSADHFDKIIIPTDVNDKTKYSIDYDNITLNNNKLLSNDRNVIVDKKSHTITIKIDKNSIPDKTHFNLVVPYKLTENITVHYIDEDKDANGEKEQEINHTSNSKVDNSMLNTSYSGDPATSITNLTQNSIDYLERLGYKLDESATNGGTSHVAMNNYHPGSQNFKGTIMNGVEVNKYSDKKLVFDNDEYPDNQVYYVYFYHDDKEDKNKKEQKSIDEVIHYVDENDPTDDLARAYTSQPLTFTRDANVDQVTGEVVSWNKWTTGDLKAKDNPIIPDYTIDLHSSVLSQELNGKTDDLATITPADVSAITAFDTQTAIGTLPLNKTSKIEIIIPYKQNPSNPNPGGKTTPPTSTPTPSNPPTTPTSPKPTTPPTTPKTPTTPPTTPTQKTKTPKTPKVPKNKGPKNPGKPNNKPKTPTTSKPRKGRGYKYNTNVHGENINGRNKRNYDSNNRPLGERTGGNSTVTPLGTSGRGNTSETITPLGTKTSSGDNAQTTTLRSPKNAEQANSQETTLPETGETNTSRLGIIGLCVALLGSIFGLAYKKRKE